MMYCQPHIAAVFNFLIRDERNLVGWQSGVLWADGSRKDSYDDFRSIVREVNERRVDCDKLKAAPGVPVARAPSSRRVRRRPRPAR